ncbi:hypothetical protein E7T09_08600 [Deinococcus sp. KSM4-11]|uniref:fibronectin type III domain-containing protein n=1 Tax=Deinococcus sp. KSM4-11 TaxID=2568654 RepID=UPI0010A3F3A5|nr:hypothetical protein [Deinococcus sp. KSM4-11]THF87204.1 hypothetical protein E7T09_08600 [Deinococcus sp. KSM4-11]
MRPTRTILSLTLLTPLSLSLAETGNTNAPSPSTKTGVAALPTPDGALLRWYLPGDRIPGNGFVVQISGTSGEQSLPVASPQPFSAALGISQEEYKAITAIYQGAPTEDSRIQRAIFNLNVVARPGYARALGIQAALHGLTPGAYTATVYVVNGSARTRVGSAAFRTGPTPAVPAPIALKATTNFTGAQLTWTPPSSDTGLVVAYNVYRAGAAGGFTRLDPAPFFRTTGPGGDVFQDMSLNSGQTGRYQVTAVDLFGRESAPTTAVTVTATAGPVSPEITRATSGNRTVTLDWAASPDARVKTVLVLRGTTPDNLTTIATVASSNRTYVDRTVQGGVDYLYALAAADQNGQPSGRSTLTEATGRNLTPPAAPRGLKVTSGEKTLALTWAANAEPDLRGYLVYRSEGEGTAAPELLLTGLPIQVTSYTDAIPQGVQTRYHYRLVAVNTSQIGSSPSVPASAALLDTTAPPAPVLAAVSLLPGGLGLTWIQAEVPDLAGFEVIRQSGTAPATVLKALDAGNRTYLDTSAVSGVLYTYGLRSLDRAGNRSQVSAGVTASRPAATGDLHPTDLKAVLLPDKAGVRLTWAAGSAQARYAVYRLNGAAEVQVSDLLSTLSFTDPQGHADSRYVLRSVSAAGVVSEPTPVAAPGR